MPTRYKIDSVSNLYPALGGHVFRFCAVLREEIDVDLLRKATQGLAPRFPIMCSYLERTLMSYVHVPASDYDIIADGEPFIQLPAMYDTQKPSFRLYVRGNRLAMDVFHANGDGGAALNFLKALVTDYCLLACGKPPLPPTPPAPDTLKDPYVQHYKRSKMAPLLEKDSYAIRLSYPKEHWYMRFSCFDMPTAAIKSYTKPRGYSVNDFLTAALYFAIRRVTDAAESDLPVTISTPIDLRAFFHVQSQRNFSYYTNVRIPREKAGSFDEVLACVHQQVSQAVNDKGIHAAIATAYIAANNLAVRAVPRALREFAIRKVYRHVAGHSITTTISNLGAHTLEAPAADMVERFEFYLGAGRGGINASAVGLGDTVSFCLTCGSEETVLEEAFVQVLQEKGISCVWNHFAYRNGDLLAD